MRHLVYSFRYSVVLITSSLLTVILYSLVIVTLVYNKKSPVLFMTLYTSSTVFAILFPVSTDVARLLGAWVE
jgi:hypothetical protein